MTTTLGLQQFLTNGHHGYGMNTVSAAILFARTRVLLFGRILEC